MKLFAILALSFALYLSEPQSLPVIHCEDLNGTKVNLPADRSGKKTVVVFAFSIKAEKGLKEWAQPLYNSLIADAAGGMMGGSIYNANLCMVAMLKGLAKLNMEEMREKSRKEIKDKKLYTCVMSSDDDREPVIQLLKDKDTGVPHFFVLDEKGNITYQTSGVYTDKKLNEITDQLMN